MAEKEYDVIIVGAGAAGLSAAIYARRAGSKTAVFERASYGGQIVVSTEVENYPGIKHMSGFHFATELYEQVLNLGAEIIFENVIKISENTEYTVETDSNSYKAKAVIISTGMVRRKLGIEREEELTGFGVSYCATCDGAFFKEKAVMVTGGGNTALEDAVFLSEYCEKVYLVHHRDEFRAEKELVNQMKKRKNIECIMNSSVKELIGKERLEAVIVKDTQNEKEKKINVSGLFIAIGQIPNSEMYKDIVKTNDKGYVIAEENCRTDRVGIFVAGDCRTKDIRQLVTATADGAVAALAAVDFCRKTV